MSCQNIFYLFAYLFCKRGRDFERKNSSFPEKAPLIKNKRRNSAASKKKQQKLKKNSVMTSLKQTLRRVSSKIWLRLYVPSFVKIGPKLLNLETRADTKTYRQTDRQTDAQTGVVLGRHI